MVERPRPSTHALDEISAKIGELTAYTHEHRHGVNNLSAKFDALAIDIVKRVEALDTKMTLRIDEVVKSLSAENATLRLRVEQLEHQRQREEGARGFLIAIINNPAVGWIVAAVGAVAAFWAREKGI